jgi:hypothetical protein
MRGCAAHYGTKNDYKKNRQAAKAAKRENSKYLAFLAPWRFADLGCRGFQRRSKTDLLGFAQTSFLSKCGMPIGPTLPFPRVHDSGRLRVQHLIAEKSAISIRVN